jgi:hypothetical protein
MSSQVALLLNCLLSRFIDISTRSLLVTVDRDEINAVSVYHHHHHQAASESAESHDKKPH